MGSLPQLPREMLIDQLQNGLILLLLGMCTVFIFLTILVFTIKLLTSLVVRFSGDGKVLKVQKHEKPVSAATPVPSRTVSAAAISIGPVEVKAPMPGLILRTEVKVGDTVRKNQLLLVMEAMKMENEVYAPCDGVVSEIKISLGQQMNAEDTLVVLKGSESVAGAVDPGVKGPEPIGRTTATTVRPSAAVASRSFLHVRENSGLRGVASVRSTLVLNAGVGAAMQREPLSDGLWDDGVMLNAGSASPSSAAPVAAPAASPVGGTTVKAPMPGLILRTEVKEGDVVKKNQLLLVMEAMKMENEIYSPVDGTVTRICVAQGQQMNADDDLVVIG